MRSSRAPTLPPSYDGSAFARDGVVLVSINYRLGTYGWLPVDGAPTNLGMRDQIAGPAVGAGQHRGVRRRPRQCHDLRRVGRRYERCGPALSARRRVACSARPSCRAGTGFGRGVRRHPPVGAEVAALLGVEPTAQALAEVDPSALIDAQTAIDNAIRLAPDPGRWGADHLGRGGITGHIPVSR